MQQQINLYNLLAQKKLIHFSLKSLLISFVAFFLILFISHLYQARIKQHLITELNDMKIRLEKGQESISQTTSGFPSLSSKELSEFITQLENSLGSKSKIVKSLSQQAEFSRYLIAFGQSTTPGAWLTQITMTHAGEEIALHGRAQNAEQVQRLLDNLKNNVFFKGRQFEVGELTQEASQNKEEINLNFLIINKSNSE